MPKKRKQVPVIQTQYAKIFVELFAENGFDVHQLLRDADLPSDLMDSNSDYVPSESVKRLLYLVSAQLGVTNLADILSLSFKRNIIPKLLDGISGYDTLRDVLEDIDSIFTFDSPGSSVSYSVEHGQHWFNRHTKTEYQSEFQWKEIFPILYIEQFISMLIGKPWRAEKVRLQGAEYDIVKSVLDSRCQIFVMQDKTGVCIPEEFLDYKVSIKQSTKQPIEWHASFTDSVFETLRPYCLEQNLTVEDAAEILEYSVRSFQRRLKEENTSFRKIKDSILLSLACELMEQGKTLTFIAKQLGYQDISHFSRAFKRITGLTPKLYKKSLAPEKG
ncbi:helix-turn-helix domain-containing protein [Vibrio ishigakensis]|nr:AraC family transcriptional regulator [Vibrio ishigakensis]